MSYIPRFAEPVIHDILRTFKVLYVSGPRQVGKTTLLHHTAVGRDIRAISLDDLSVRRLAQNDPDLLLQQYPAPLLIDEVQYAPALFPALKARVDRQEARGRYWLTGSQHFTALQHVQESLAGRVGIMRLLGLSYAELKRRPRAVQPWLPSLTLPDVEPVAASELFAAIWRGFFPALWVAPAPEPARFYSSYIQTYVERDIRELYGVEKITEFHRFLELCAARTGQLLSYADLARDAGVSVHAAREWVAILEQTSIVHLLRPWHANIGKRLVKAPKLYFLDTGLAAYLTKWQSPETLQAGATAGALFETFVVSEIIKSYLVRGLEPPLWFYRDQQKREIDLLIQHEDTIYPVEIKLSAAVTEQDARHIDYLRTKLPSLGLAAIIGVGQQAVPINRTTVSIPASTLN